MAENTAEGKITGEYIYTEKLAVGYGKTPLIENIALRVRRGQIVTLIGPNDDFKEHHPPAEDSGRHGDFRRRVPGENDGTGAGAENVGDDD